MSRFLKTIFYITIFGAVVFVLQQPIDSFWQQLNTKYLPCRTPIKYSINIFDEQFDISRQEFLRSIKTAEDIWEDPIGKDLFEFNPLGDLKINLIYDNRQEATTRLDELGIKVGNDKASYEKLKSKYTELQSKYQQERSSFEKRIIAFEERQAVYEKEVNFWNQKGGADEKTYIRLNQEKNHLETEVKKINDKQVTLNTIVEDINAIVVTINRLVTSLNIQVEKLNTIGKELGEFEEGTYQSDADGQRINIYQFDNKTKLVRVLAHEFGHALGLEHLEDEKAIMYRLNNGINEKLTEADLVALRALCKIE